MEKQKLIYIVTLLVTQSMVSHLIPNLALPYYMNITIASTWQHFYGVYGWCYVSVDEMLTACTRITIGYVDIKGLGDAGVVVLPTFTEMRISNLLVVHPLGFLFTALLWISCVMLLVPRFSCSKSLTLVSALLSLPVFLLTLLCILVDLLMFGTAVDWPVWWLLVSTVTDAICCSSLWIIRRKMPRPEYKPLQTDFAKKSTVQVFSITNGEKDTKGSDENEVKLLLLHPENSYLGSST